jgi:hypothetical protein
MDRTHPDTEPSTVTAAWTAHAGPVVFKTQVGAHCFASVHQSMAMEHDDRTGEWAWAAGCARDHGTFTASGTELTREAAEAEALAWIERHG